MRYLGRKLSKSITDDLKFFEHSFKITKVDKDDFYQAQLPKSSRVVKFIEDHEEEYHQVYELSLDIYMALFQYVPILQEENRISGEYMINYFAIKELLEDPKYKEIRSITRHDELSSLMGIEIFLEKLWDSIKNIQEKHKQAISDYEKAKAEYLEAVKKAREEGDAEDMTMQKAQKALEEAREDLKKLYSKKVKRQVKKGINDLLKDVSDTSQTSMSWGLGNDGTFQRMSYEEKTNLLGKLKNNEKLKKIALLAGKLTEIFLEGKKAKTRKTRSHIEDITLGDDIPRVLPSEMVKFRHKAYKKYFIRQYAQKRLLQHEYGGKVKKGKGPIVAMVDCSGSMMGENEIYSKATCMALLDVAKRQRRSFLVVHFDSGVGPKDLKINRFSKKNPYNIKEVIDMAEYFGGGGTEFEPPLKRAQIEINEEREFSKADVIMITDGCAPIGDNYLKELVEWKKKKNVTIFSILISGGWSNTETLEKFSNQIKQIENISSDGTDVARSLFTSLL